MAARSRKEVARSRSIRTGLVTVALLFGIVAFAITAQNGMPEYVPGVSRTEVKAIFADTGALRAGDDVRIANVRAGFIDSIEIADGKPVVTMRLDGGRPVYADASASIGTRSAMGQKFLELFPGTTAAGRMPAGEVIPLERTTNVVELDEVLGTFDPETRTRLGQLVRNTGRGLGGRGEDLNAGLAGMADMLGDLEDVSSALTEDEGADLVDLLDAADLLAGSLASQRDDIAALTRDMGVTYDALATDDGVPFEAALRAAPEAMASVRGALQSLDEPLARTEAAAVALRPGLEALARATPSLRGFLRDGVAPLRQVPTVTGPARTAVDALTPMLADARPVVDQLTTAVTTAERPLSDLQPYAPEVMLFFTNAASALSQGDGAGRWLRFYPVFNPEIFIGNLPLRSPLTQREAYPAPGTAQDHRTNDLFDDQVETIGELP